MQEILFRAKKKGTEEWTEGFYAEHPVYGPVIIIYASLIADKMLFDVQEIDKTTLGQFVAFDANGQRIYDGHFVKIINSDIVPWWADEVETVHFRDGSCWPFDRDCEDTGYAVEPNNVVVIGNIYDNSDLKQEET